MRMQNDIHTEIVEKSIKNNVNNKEELIYIFDDFDSEGKNITYSKDEVLEIGEKVLVEKHGPIKYMKKRITHCLI